jgi:hypothetical protein
MLAATMELSTNNGDMLRDPTAAQLKAALDALDPDNGYAVLARSDQHYLQVAGSRTTGYLAEYREGSPETHCASANAALPHALVQALLATYLANGNWRRMVVWQNENDAPQASAPEPENPPRRRKRAKAESASESSLFVWAFLLPFGAVGVGAAALGIYTAVDSVRFKQRAVPVPGQVVELVGHDTQSAVVEYTDATGEPRRVTSGWATSPPAFDVGERVQVLHDPTEPKDARIDSFGEMWGASLFASVFALAFGGASAGVGVTTWRARKRRGTA